MGILATFAVCGIGTAAHFAIKLQHAEAGSAALCAQIVGLEQKVEANEEIAQELERCLEEMDDPSKRNSEDMEAYINARYPGVAKELAKVISVETERLSIKYDLPFSLVVGLMEVESRFNPFAKSSVGARGLLQVMPDIWCKELGLKNSRELHGIATGINAGLYVLKHYVKKNKGNITKALKNYNGTKKDVFHTSVYKNVGRFTVFRANAYHKAQLEVKDDREDSSGEDSRVFGTNQGEGGRES